MKVNFFIDRPVFSAVISILIVIIGIIGLLMLPIDQYPQITPPVVKVSASYPGASALTVSQAVATPIEQELNGTPGMLYMESNSSNSGGFSATITFDISADADLAAVEIQNRVKLAESRLPAEVVQNGIEVEKQASNQLLTVCLTSSDPKYDEIYLSNFATLNVLDLLRRIPGVGRVSNIGSRYYAMQIWVDPAKLANFGLTVKDVQNALKDQNRESAAGVFGQQPVDGIVHHYTDGKYQAEQCENIERETHYEHEAESAYQRNWHCDDRNHCRTPALQREEHHDSNEQQCFEESFVHFVYRLGDVLGHIKRYLICKPLGEALADVVHFLFYQVGHFHCICSRQQVHAQHSGIATVDATLGDVGLRFERHSCHVAHSD